MNTESIFADEPNTNIEMSIMINIEKKKANQSLKV